MTKVTEEILETSEEAVGRLRLWECRVWSVVYCLDGGVLEVRRVLFPNSYEARHKSALLYAKNGTTHTHI